MQLQKIITLSNKNTRLRLLAMERSLRATGCKLPLWVIPYDNDKFDLPEGATWWEIASVLEWLSQNKAHKTMRKYQCLLENNYQFVDSDVIFLKNPENVLNDFSGFITSCGHWHNTGHTTTHELLHFFDQRTTIWQQKVFNTGQFACDVALYNVFDLKRFTESAYRATCLDFTFHEQPGLNLLVNASGVSITNLTLQPHYMESTWAGDYNDENFERFWRNENTKPYLIHWAGCDMNINRPINRLFLEFLTEKERDEWNKKVSANAAKQNEMGNRIKKHYRKLKAAVKTLRN